ncbi:hypothetical protein CA54_52060 [Symmachiella macrocystis]|uniref:Uncharacterized protein n=1 Tax=Symmachiella macrocystis TaxID=2527985 RepID=A0A5C6B4Y2_9PLAN|nr:DUF6717 family protein [Symmachiella macrocystis]TWU06807.1 hypothetical protein CA54_52060 [Symmachiella macrocystis]
MNESKRPVVNSRRVIVYSFLAIAIAGGLTWYYGIKGDARAAPSSNSVMIIQPYRYAGTWVFDDTSVGLVREPFVAGVPEMIDALVADIPDAEQGFRLTFSAAEFPGYQKKLTWTRSDGTGNYYRLDDPPMEGWICPALFQYYTAPPNALFVKADPVP